MADESPLEEDVGNAIVNLYLVNGHIGAGSVTEQLEAEHYAGVAFYALRRACNKSTGPVNHELCAVSESIGHLYETLRIHSALSSEEFGPFEKRDMHSAVNIALGTLEPIYKELVPPEKRPKT